MGRYNRKIPKNAKKLNKKSFRDVLVVVLLVVVFLLAIAVGMLLFLLFGSEKTEIDETTSETGSAPIATEDTTFGETQTGTEETGDTSEPVDTMEDRQPTEQETEPEQTEPPEASNPPQIYYPGVTTPTKPAKTIITLPYVIPGTDLVIQQVASYEGIYLEDGSDVDVTDVAMVLLYNAGNKPVEYAKILMQFDDKTLIFEVSGLPVGGKVVAQEYNKNSCATGDLLECTADVATREELEMSEGVLSVVDNEDNTLTITNLTDTDIVTVRIFYKYYMADEKAYVGGITYTAKISNLKANESVVISPSHYVSGASTVIMVRTYDTDA